MANFDLNEVKRRMEGSVSAFKHDIASLRTGRASANVLDPVQVEAYGSRMPLNQVANITVPEPRMVSVQVWDRSNVQAVDKAIREANLGVNPVVDGTMIRLPIPAPTAERFLRTNFRSRYAALGGAAVTASPARNRSTSAARPLAVSYRR